MVPKPLTTENLKQLEDQLPKVRRPMSAVTRTSRDTIKPANLTRVRLMTIANDIFRWKGAITDLLKESGESA